MEFLSIRWSLFGCETLNTISWSCEPHFSFWPDASLCATGVDRVRASQDAEGEGGEGTGHFSAEAGRIGHVPPSKVFNRDPGRLLVAAMLVLARICAELTHVF